MKAREQIKKLSIEQKAALLQGKTVWTTYAFPHAEIPEIFLSDGPHGLRKQAGSADHLGLNESIPATCFPTAAGMANSWNLDLAERLGRALGEEAAANDVHVLLGPGLNIKRSPLCGRNFEYFSEDPYLAGKMAAAYIKGIQANGVAACPKHFAVNSQELRRMAMNSVLDERTLREIYLTAFEIAVKEGKAKAIMSAYNMVNGTYANENAHLLSDILRNEWGFDGFVVTDWGADNNHTDGVRAGCNLVMPAPGPDCALGLIQDCKDGKIDESVLDERLEELLGVIHSTHEAVAKAPKSFDVDAHHALAKACAAESIVLLENDGILPLASDAKVAVIGDFAKEPRYQGAGSSQVNPTRVDNLYDCLMEAGVTVTAYAKGFDRKSPTPDQALIDEAVEAAKSAQTVLLCVGLDEILESEGMDRTHIDISHAQKALLEAVCAVNKNVILVLSGGAPFVVPKEGTYRAAIHGYLGGQAGAGAMADAILGKINPSGRLNESWPLSLEDVSSNPYFPSKERSAEYREGLYVGYRYFESAGVPVRYPFGYGLSYTSFAYSDIKVTDKDVSVTVTNTGALDGAEVVQLYVSCEDSKIYRPEKELKGFAKVFLAAGESQRVTIAFDDKTFRYFDTADNAWQVEDADYDICIAKNAHEVILSGVLHVPGKKVTDNVPACYKKADIKNVTDADFESLLGHPIPDGKWGGEITENDALCQLYYAKGAFARFLYRILTSLKEKADAKGKPDINILFIYNMPIRSIAKMSGGLVSQKMTEDILFIMNGHAWRGLGRLIVDFFKNLSRMSKFKKTLKKVDNKE